MIYIIAAVSLNNVIGNKGKIPWKISNDLKRFKKLTLGNVVVMGRKTYESIGRALPNRKNIVISKQNINFKDALKVSNPENIKEQNFFVIGGETIYNYFIDKADVLYLTHIHLNVEGDTFFPNVNLNQFRKEFVGSFTNKMGVSYEFINYIR